MYELSRKQCDELIEMIPRFNDYDGFNDLLSVQSSVAMLISGTDAINRCKQLFEGISLFLAHFLSAFNNRLSLFVFLFFFNEMHVVYTESDIIDSETDPETCTESTRIYFTNAADEVIAVSAVLSLNLIERFINGFFLSYIIRQKNFSFLMRNA